MVRSPISANMKAPTDAVITIYTPEQIKFRQDAVASSAKNEGYALAKNTYKSYDWEWGRFVLWCSLAGEQALPAAPETVQMYIASVADKKWEARSASSKAKKDGNEKDVKFAEGRKPSGLTVALSAIGWKHVAAGYEKPTTAQIVVEEMAALRRRVGKPPNKKSPLTLELLRDMIAELRAEMSDAPTAAKRLRAARDRAILLIGFAGAFRRSEVAALRHKDVTFVDKGVDIFLRKSKTDQEGVGRSVPIPKGVNAVTCPVIALREWMAAFDDKGGPIFVEIDRIGRLCQRPGDEGLSGHAVAKMVKDRTGLNDEEMARFSGHSMRAGIITAAAEAGRDIFEMMETSRHKDADTLLEYVRSAKRFERAASRGLL